VAFGWDDLKLCFSVIVLIYRVSLPYR